jgi:hypothetical protein
MIICVFYVFVSKPKFKPESAKKVPNPTKVSESPFFKVA